MRLALSEAARAGSVPAQRLYWEMLRADDEDDDANADPLLAELEQAEQCEMVLADIGANPR